MAWGVFTLKDQLTLETKGEGQNDPLYLLNGER